MDFDFNDHVYMVASTQHSTNYTVQQSSSHSSESTKIEHEIRELLKILPQRSDLLVEKLTNEPIHVQHAEKILKQAKHVDYVSQDLLKLKIMLFGYYLWGSYDINKAKLVIENLEYIFIHNNITLDLYNQALFLYHKSFFQTDYKRDYKTAIEHALQAFNILQNEENLYEEKLSIITSIAQWFATRGLNDQAEIWLIKGQKIFKHSESHAFNSYYNYVKILYFINKGLLNEGLELIKLIKYDYDKLEYFPTIQYSLMHREVELLIKSNKFEDAKTCNDLLFKRINTFFKGRNDSHMVRNLLYQGWIALETERNYDQAVKDINKSIEMANLVFHGPEAHIIQGLQHTVLGRALEGQQKYAQALVEYQFAERIYKKILEQLNGMDDVSVLYQHLMQISLKLNQLEQAQQYLQTHIDLFGPDHPRSKEMQKMLTVSHH